MPPGEMYPWSTLERVGDYFIVLHEFKPYEHMNATISVRNRNMKGRIKYCCVKTTYGSIVMVAQVQDYVPEHEVEILPGLLARTTNVGPSPVSLGNKPVSRQLTQQERINMMSWQMRKANLPWWYDEKGTLVANGLKEPELSKWMSGQFKPHPEAPYPDHYNLDENLMRREVEEPDEVEEWENDEPPIINGGEDDVELNDPE